MLRKILKIAVLLATGKLPLSADLIISHDKPHTSIPPGPAPSQSSGQALSGVEGSGQTHAFGRHLAATCMGCHGEDLGGGPIIGGDPSWPPAANLSLS